MTALASPQTNHQKVEDCKILLKIQQKTQVMKHNWIRVFEGSIELWVNFILFKTKTLINQAQINKCAITDFNQVQLTMTSFLQQTQQCVLQGLRNIEKIYMMPKNSKNNFTSQKQQNKMHIESPKRDKPQVHEKSRSLSTGGKTRKFSLFGKTRSKNHTQLQFMKPKSSQIKQTFSINPSMNKTVLKHYKPKPRFDQDRSLTSSNFAAFKSAKEVNVADQLQKTLCQKFQTKQKQTQKNLEQIISHKFEDKLKAIQSSLNFKLNTIIESLVNKTLKVEKKNDNNLQNQDNLFKQQSNELKETQNKNNKISRSDVKKNSIRQIITTNPLAQEEIPQNQIKLPQTLEIKNTEIISVQKNLHDFVKFAIEKKLPFNPICFKVFAFCYIEMCKQNGLQQNLEKVGFAKDQIMQSLSNQETMKQFNSGLKTLKTLFCSDKKKVKEKLQPYVEKFLRCCYDLVLKQPHQMREETKVELDLFMCRM